MPTLHYRILNVFAESTFGGNPLAVIEDGSNLSDADMQCVARQFNLSETTFLLASTAAAARVRIFTPSYEMAFAGHPTLGSAHVVSDLLSAGESFGLEMKGGIILVQKRGRRWTLSANPATHRELTASTAELASMLGLPEAAIARPVYWVDCGTEQPMIALTSAQYVTACKPNAALLSRFCTNRNGQVKAYVFARTADGFESRYFWMTDQNSVSEDPGTGSACANLGRWWCLTEGDKPLVAIVRQGAAVKRPSLLALTVENGKVEVGGEVILVGKGTLFW